MSSSSLPVIFGKRVVSSGGAGMATLGVEARMRLEMSGIERADVGVADSKVIEMDLMLSVGEELLLSFRIDCRYNPRSSTESESQD